MEDLSLNSQPVLIFVISAGVFGIIIVLTICVCSILIIVFKFNFCGRCCPRRSISRISPQETAVLLQSEQESDDQISSGTFQPKQEFDDQISETHTTLMTISNDSSPSHMSNTIDHDQVNQPLDKLTINDIKEVFGKLYPARHKWQNIGIHLGMTGDLDPIRQENHEHADDCLREMLKVWLRRGTASRTALNAALKSPGVNYPDIAAGVLKDISSYQVITCTNACALKSSEVGFKCPQCGNCSIQEYLNGNCPEADVSSDSPFCCLDVDHLKEDERITLCMKLINETNDIAHEFSVLVNNLRQTLKQQHIKPSDIANFIFDTASSDLLNESLQSDPQFITEVLTEASSIDMMINYLQRNKYISFVNYQLLEDLINKYGKEDETLQDALHSYHKKFVSFCQRSIFEIPRHAYRIHPADGERLKFKVTKNFGTSLPQRLQEDDDLDPGNHRTLVKSSMTLKLSLGDTLAIQNRVANALGSTLKSIGRLIFLDAFKGCIELTFSAPRDVMNLVKPNLNIIKPTEIESVIGSNFANLESMGIHMSCGPPGKPHAIEDSITCNSITLEWKEPEYEGFYPVQWYFIHYRSTTDLPGRWRTMRTENSNTIFEITRLPNNKMPFIFKLQVVNDIGTGIESESSDPIYLMKLPCAPDKLMNNDYSSRPGKPRALKVTHDSIQLEWTKPKQGADNVIAYTILYRSTHDHNEHWIELKAITTEESVVVSGLSGDTKYLFLVQPECGTGVGLESNISDHIRTEVMISNRPGKPIALKVTHNSVLIQWTKPEQGAENITTYTVFYRSANDSPNKWKKDQVTTTQEALVTQLSECSIYYFKIRADSGDIGIESDIMISYPVMTKMIGKPGKPRVLKVNHDSIELEWSNPKYGAHSITSYTVLYRSLNDPPDNWMERLHISTNSVVLSQLSESTVYYLKLDQNVLLMVCQRVTSANLSRQI